MQRHGIRQKGYEEPSFMSVVLGPRRAEAQPSSLYQREKDLGVLQA
jgi:hypothetical protein